MTNSSSSALLHSLVQLSQTLKLNLSETPYNPPEGSPNVAIKSTLQDLLPNPNISEANFRTHVKDFVLCCASLASALNSSTEHLSWIPNSLSFSALSALEDFASAYYNSSNVKDSIKIGELELDLRFLESAKRLVIELISEVLPLLKDKIKESAIDASDDGDGISAASAKAPVAYAIVAAYQFRWFVTQVDGPILGKLCPLVVPCALTALDHWSQEVKGQGMISFIHLGKIVNAADFGSYVDVILDACCQNVASDDEIWDYVVEMSVLLVTSTQRNNPRSQWFEKLLNEMLNHLERQPRNKQRRTAWLTHIEPLFNVLGLLLLAHFRRLFPLFFKWMHADDDETVLLVLERTKTVLRVTWIRNSPFIERFVDELITLYKEAALKVNREPIRSLVLQILTLIQHSNGSQFDATWKKYKDDPDLISLSLSFHFQLKR
ncbi:uncharacterized protein At2g39910 isoform X2 [Olea europaea subsp. europaea]|uniref:Uncharacterized protein At2g39910 isoform X2 n=1 Tax=Olea europaea subsp. europaea TaxID=158383 RepID=A0A8S0UCH6_OLEEU|nr:uncharacterized protein At2g39910 isoform X2 [Olea europaea subsp. europaea]